MDKEKEITKLRSIINRLVLDYAYQDYKYNKLNNWWKKEDIAIIKEILGKEFEEGEEEKGVDLENEDIVDFLNSIQSD